MALRKRVAFRSWKSASAISDDGEAILFVLADCRGDSLGPLARERKLEVFAFISPYVKYNLCYAVLGRNSAAGATINRSDGLAWRIPAVLSAHYRLRMVLRSVRFSFLTPAPLFPSLQIPPPPVNS